MKNLILVCAFFSVTLLTGAKTIDSNNVGLDNTHQENKIIATFDGAEGNYFFFTDSQENALQFENIAPNVVRNYNLVAGDYIGYNFEITYNNTKIIALKRIAN
ncbi:hypothetical protein [Polaribacter sp. IC073]|uniref:hypothetical protein n=1 Tax=Polaribacter sp. IC073 TaxID=2508540 RepID=UPI0011BED314|nr:hypothetical protein [Polaribacter sp. IC073]TXD50077.1 hypothetical protein ES045_02550 [Polaribacter sp. IC073]